MSRRSVLTRGSGSSVSSTTVGCSCSRCWVASATGTNQMGGVSDFYGALWSEARAHSRQVAIAVEAVMIVAWLIVRTVAGSDSPAYLVWVAAAGILALVAPRS